MCTGVGPSHPLNKETARMAGGCFSYWFSGSSYDDGFDRHICDVFWSPISLCEATILTLSSLIQWLHVSHIGLPFVLASRITHDYEGLGIVSVFVVSWVSPNPNISGQFWQGFTSSKYWRFDRYLVKNSGTVARRFSKGVNGQPTMDSELCCLVYWAVLTFPLSKHRCFDRYLVKNTGRVAWRPPKGT